jgi:hypothetical protein
MECRVHHCIHKLSILSQFEILKTVFVRTISILKPSISLLNVTHLSTEKCHFERAEGAEYILKCCDYEE